MTENSRGQGIDPTNFNRDTFTQFQAWLGETKGVEGCPVNCRYCFFKLDGLTPARPRQMATPEEVVERLKLSPTYQEKIPVHFGSQTDAFSTRENIDYYTKLVQVYGRSDYPNPLVFITKRRIPVEFIELSKQIPQDVVFYVSYSGLAGTDLEPTVVEKDQRENFVTLHEHNVPVVHYWRPFTPQNSRPEKIRDVLDHVSQYANCSVANGLRLNSGIKDQIGPFWPELNERNFDFSNLGEIWPTGVREELRELVVREYGNYPVFFGNTQCALSRSLHQPDRVGYFNGRMCRESNCDQREMCQIHHHVPSREEAMAALAEMGIGQERMRLESNSIYIEGEVGTQNLVYLRHRLNFPVLSAKVDYTGGHNWANVTDEVKITEVDWKRA